MIVEVFGGEGEFGSLGVGCAVLKNERDRCIVMLVAGNGEE